MAYDETRYMNALKAAHQAGDTAAATKIAAAIKSHRASAQPAAAPVTAAPAPAPVLTPEQTRAKAMSQIAGENSFGDNALVAAGGNLLGLWGGAKDLVADAGESMGIDNSEWKKELEAEERERRAVMEAMHDTGGGWVGDIGTSVLTGMVPGAAVSKAGRVANMLRSSPIKSRIAGEALTGAGFAALNPTLGDESRTENMGTSAAFGAAVPALGAALRTTPIREAADKIGEYTPGLVGRAVKLANQRIKGEHDLAKSGIEAEKAAAQSKLDLAHRNAMQQVYSKLGVDEIPTKGTQLKKMVDQIGSDYGNLVRNERINVDPQAFRDLYASVKPTLGKSGRTGIKYQINRIMEDYAKNGYLSGDVYAAVRSDLSREAKGEKSSAYINAMSKLIKDMDDSFDDSVTPEISELVNKGRERYALGNLLTKVDIKPGEITDLHKLRKLANSRSGIADNDSILKSVEKYLESAERVIPQKKLSAAQLKAFDDKLAPLNLDTRDNVAAAIGTGALATATGGASIPLQYGFALAPSMAMSKPTAATMAALLRGANVQNENTDQPPPLMITHGR